MLAEHASSLDEGHIIDETIYGLLVSNDRLVIILHIRIAFV